mgnify:CR=1 FL=1
MWKYRCKTHLLSLLGAFIVGCVVTAIFFFTNTETYLQILPADVYKFISENIWLTCAAGGLSFAGVINIILIAQMLMSLYNLNPFIFIILIMFAAESFGNSRNCIGRSSDYFLYLWYGQLE